MKKALILGTIICLSSIAFLPSCASGEAGEPQTTLLDLQDIDTLIINCGSSIKISALTLEETKEGLTPYITTTGTFEGVWYTHPSVSVTNETGIVSVSLSNGEGSFGASSAFEIEVKINEDDIKYLELLSNHCDFVIEGLNLESLHIVNHRDGSVKIDDVSAKQLTLINGAGNVEITGSFEEQIDVTIKEVNNKEFSIISSLAPKTMSIAMINAGTGKVKIPRTLASFRAKYEMLYGYFATNFVSELEDNQRGEIIYGGGVSQYYFHSTYGNLSLVY